MAGAAALVVASMLFVPPGGARPAKAQEQQAPNLKVVIEPAPEEKTDNPLQQYYKVKIYDAATNQLDPAVYEVYITPQDNTGKQYEIFSMIRRRVLYPDEPEGIYGGLVYFSHGGPWKLNAVVNRYVSPIDKIRDKRLRNAPPVTYARASLDVQIEGGTLLSAGREIFFGKDPRMRPTWNAVSIAILWIHSLAASLWGAVVALFLLLALPAGRRLLSDRGSNFFDQRLGLLLRTYWWVTAVVIGTGVYNLFRNVVYRTPFNLTKARQTFNLPYAAPYFTALVVKLAMYAVMLALALPLMKEVKRRADLMGGYRPAPAGGATGADSVESNGADHDPWSGGAPTSRRLRRRAEPGDREVRAAAALTQESAVVTLAPPARATSASAGLADEDAAPVAVEEPAPFRVKAAVAVMVVGPAVLIGAVTIVKVLHTLASSIRYWSLWISGS